ncbi:MAG TPA: phosphoribosyltransferase family protein [Candidatus Acidoferrales bacterium]|nr:phosphoribosyltransferase family protein [Candidatus Acidoferrales bacterium]
MYKDRVQAGHVLADLLLRYEGQVATILAIPRGGIEVAFPITVRLRAPLDLIIPRKLPIPTNVEAGFGAITSDGSRVLNDDMISYVGLTDAEIETIAAHVLEEVKRRETKYRGGKPFPQLSGRTAIIVDDGLATGYTALAAIAYVRKRQPKRVILAVPVASKSAEMLVKPHVDEYICPLTSDRPWFAVASFYDHFSDLTDDEVLTCLKKYELLAEGW